MRTYAPVGEPAEPGGREASLSRWLETLARELQDQGGADFAHAERMMEAIRLTKRELASRLGVDPRTLGRFRERGRLNPMASDRLYRLARLFEAAIELHQDEAQAARWLKTPNQALGGVCPMDMIATEPDFEQVMNLLGALKEGVFV